MAIGVHRHEGCELDESGINAPARPGVARRNARDEAALEPVDRTFEGKRVHLGRIHTRVDGAGHQRHAARLRRVFRLRHDGNGGKDLHARLADGDDVRARPHRLEEADDVLDIFVEAEGAVLEADVAAIVPIRDEDVVVGKQRPDGAAQQRSKMAGQRRDEEHARFEPLNVFAEAQQRAKRRLQDRLFPHGDLAVPDRDRLDAVGRALVRQPRLREQLAGRRGVTQAVAAVYPCAEH